MSKFIEVKTAELSGKALDWAVAKSAGFEPITDRPACKLVGFYLDNPPDTTSVSGFPFSPSNNWAQGGPLIDKYKVMLTPPNNLVHRNFGSFDKRNGWYESGHWGSTIFGKDRVHRRAAFHHPDSPLIVAMRAIVQFVMGDAVSVPKELML